MDSLPPAASVPRPVPTSSPPPSPPPAPVSPVRASVATLDDSASATPQLETLPLSAQREQLKPPPPPPVMSGEEMMLLLRAVVNGAAGTQAAPG